MKNRKIILLSILIAITSVLAITYKTTYAITPASYACKAASDSSVTINYQTNGGNTISSTKYIGSTISNITEELPIPTKTGYTFLGWYYDQALTSKVSGEFISNVAMNATKKTVGGCTIGYNPITLYAKWGTSTTTKYICPSIANVWTLSFDRLDGTSVDKLLLSCPNNSFGEIGTPTRTGYTFKGWYYDTNFTNPVTVKNISDIKCEPVYNSANCITSYKHKTLYAKWEKKESTPICPSISNVWTLNFNTMDGSKIDKLQLNCPNSNPSAIPTPTRDGYTFAGWYYDSSYVTPLNGTKLSDVNKCERIYNSQGCIIGFKSVTIYAKWIKIGSDIKCIAITPGESWTLKYDTMGGNNINEEKVCLACNPDTSSKIPTPIREGYDFSGWYYDSEYKTPVDVITTSDIKPSIKYNNNGCMIGYNPVVIYAKWIKKDIDCSKTEINGGTVQLVYNTKGGNEIKSESICVACSPDSYQELPTPTREGYTFAGWYYDNYYTQKISGTKEEIYSHASNEYNSDGCRIGYNPVTIYAKWTAVAKINISGTLKNKNNEVYTNYIVELHSETITSTTDSSGVFHLNNATEGDHTLIVKNQNNEIISVMPLKVSYNSDSKYEENILGYKTDNETIQAEFILEGNNLTIGSNNDPKIMEYIAIGLGIIAILLIVYMTILLIKRNKRITIESE